VVAAPLEAERRVVSFFFAPSKDCPHAAWLLVTFGTARYRLFARPVTTYGGQSFIRVGVSGR
jgi:hypothetical protein